MPLSRLENFLKNAAGNILYVNPTDFDATDSYENKGNSLTRPFKTIQRALIEAARFSYQSGKNNDLIDRTTILVYPGTHYIDNRPGYAMLSDGSLRKLTGSGGAVTWTSAGTSINQLGPSFNTDLTNPSNDLHKFNSINGGVILPRGTSIIGLDLRKTKIRPLFVPDPEDDSISASSIFNVTGTCYFCTFTFLDADNSKTAYKNYNITEYVPNFSHHKLTAFVYADGVNNAIVNSNDTGLTDLQMYYNKLSLIYGSTSGRPLVSYPIGNDFEPSVDEYRIVGNLSANPIGITSIRSGDGVIANQTITVTTNTNHGLYVDSPILISGVGIDTGTYNGSFIVSGVPGFTTFTYTATSTPVDPLPDYTTYLQNSQVIIEADSVSSASPYVFSCSLRSVYGMCGMHADGSKATGFKSMVVAQYTGISLQKDDNAFLDYDPASKSYKTNDTSSNAPLHTYSSAIYKPTYENFHVKASNGAFIQCVSIFAIGYAKQFVAESGGDMSITNSNSNFGAVSLASAGFRNDVFDRDNQGYITHIIPPREVTSSENVVNWLSIDVEKTISTANTSRLYLFGYNSQSITPPYQIDSYRIGARNQGKLNLTVVVGAAQTTYSTLILMPSPNGTSNSARKISVVGRSVGINSITNNTFTLTAPHSFYNGEKVRIYSDTGESPSNVTLDKVYYANTTSGGLNSNQIKLSPTYSDAIAATPRTLSGVNNLGGVLSIVSTVTDKQPGDPGHPIQFDSAIGNWYINSSSVAAENEIYSAVVGFGTTVLGNQTTSTFVTRKLDNRSLSDRVYRLRYVIPKEASNARPPIQGFVIQESSTTSIDGTSVISGNLSDSTQLRNPKIIRDASYASNVITIQTELPHNFIAGDIVNIENVRSTNNTTGAASSVYNGSYTISNIIDSKKFAISGISTNPGTFTNIVDLRNTSQQVSSLPTVTRQKYNNSYYIYRVDEIKQYIPGSDTTGQDGIYHLTVVASNIAPTNTNVGYGISFNRYNQDIRNLYPQLDRDNYESDPDATSMTAAPNVFGQVSTNKRQNSLTKEALNSFNLQTGIGIGITGATINGNSITFFTEREHNLNSITGLSIVFAGSGYGSTSPIYAASLTNLTGSGIGSNASVKATISGGSVNGVSVVDGGSAYSVGDRLRISGPGSVVGIATVQVTSINNNIGDALQIVGVSSDALNGAFRITSIPSAKSVTVYNKNNVGFYTARTDGRYPYLLLSAEGSPISSLVYTNTSGIATVTTANPHGLLAGNKFTISGTGQTSFDNSFVVNSVVGLTTFVFNAGISTIATIYSGSGHVLKTTISPNALSIGEGEINLGSRQSYIYAGISTTLSSTLTADTTSISLTNIFGFKKGDFAQINSEVVRIVNDACTSVIRGQFGTIAASASSGTLVKKIKVIPVELRRPSYLRASGHTFEYVGYGPGNYSTGLPQKENRILSTEEIIVSQAKKQDAGTIAYSGMNDLGEFYSGAKKLSATTGEEKVFDAPIFTYAGDDANTDSATYLSGVYDSLVVKEGLTVEGGENLNRTSQFYGPVNFTGKVTSTSESGVETKNLYIKGTAAQTKLITVGISTPTSEIIQSPRSGDVSLLSGPIAGDHAGHIYVGGVWRRFAPISLETNIDNYRFDKLGIGATTVQFTGTNQLEVNGTALIKTLTVTDTVNFPSQQTFSNLAFDGITIYNTATFPGTNVSASAYATYTQIHQSGISQLYNLEVVGTAATFKNTANLIIQSPLNSTFTGVSTFSGHLSISGATITNLVSTSSTITTLGSTVATLTNASGTNINFTGVGTIATLGSTVATLTNVSGTNLNISGISTFGSSGIRINGSSSGETILSASATASGTLTLPATTDTLVARNTSDTLTNKTIAAGSNTITGLTNTNLSGSAGISNANLANSTISGISLGSNLGDLTLGTHLSFASGSTYNGGTARQIVTNATSSWTVGDGSKIVARDAQGDFTARNITATTLIGALTNTLTLNTSGTGLSGSTSFNNSGATTFTVTSNATNSNTGGAIVARDGSGNFSAGTITATFSGNITGNVTGNVTGNLSGSVTGGTLSGTTGTLSSTLNINTSAATGGDALVLQNGGDFRIYNSGNAGSVSLYCDTNGVLNISGAISASGDITALTSDIRLKTNIEPIENALNKVLKLNGFTYNFNEIAEKLGLNSSIRHSGVSAQDVQEVLPEAVKPAPVNSEYLTVQYEKIVPLLIEAIKELSDKVTELESNAKKL
jgi:hypothetical protein